MNTNTYTLKTNPAKYANLHACDQKYWKFSCDFSQAQDADTLYKAIADTTDLLTRIVKAKAFKPENVAAAKELLVLVGETGLPADPAVATFVVYQLQRYAFRIWYRDTKAARDAATPKKAPAKQEKKPAVKAPATPKAKATAKKAPAKQDVAKANEATFVSKLTKAQKKDLVLALMAELLK